MRKACYLTGELLYWILCLTLILNIYFYVYSVFALFIVVSGSMEPAIKTGSISWVNCRADAETHGAGGYDWLLKEMTGNWSCIELSAGQRREW